MSESGLPQPRAGELVIASLSQARKHKRRFDAVLTLEDPACRSVQQLRFTKRPSPDHLVLAFEDVDDDTLGVRVATSDQVEKALAFGRRHVDHSLLVHCFHGLGRSAGVALAILAERLGPGHEPQALEQVLSIRPAATPNRVVIKLADQLLGREGALITAVDAWEAANPEVQAKRQGRLALVKANPSLFTWNI